LRQQAKEEEQSKSGLDTQFEDASNGYDKEMGEPVDPSIDLDPYISQQAKTSPAITFLLRMISDDRSF
jgi:hypothetical protein